MSTTPLVEEGDKRLLSACAIVALDLLTTAREELESGVGRNAVATCDFLVQRGIGINIRHNALLGISDYDARRSLIQNARRFRV